VTLLDSLLDAILRLDGDALVMHVGEKPYVVTTSSSNSTFRGPLSWGHVELSSRPLTADAVLGMLGQMLTHEQTRQLYELGAIEHEIPAPGTSDEQFIVTAARGGDDVWVEVRRKSKATAPAEPAVAAGAISGGEPAVEIPQLPAPVQPPAVDAPVDGVHVEEPIVDHEPTPIHAESAIVNGPLSVEDESAPAEEPAGTVSDPIGIEMPIEPAVMLDPDLVYEIVDLDDIDFGAVHTPIVEGDSGEPALASIDEDVELTLDLGLLGGSRPGRHEISLSDLQPLITHTADPSVPLDLEPVSIVLPELPQSGVAAGASSPDEETVAELVEAISKEVLVPSIAPEPGAETASPVMASAEPAPAPVVPIARPPLRLQPVQAAPPPAASTEASLVELLRTVLPLRASTLYVVTGSRPMIRVDSEIAQLGTEPIVTSAEVERFALEFAPRDQLAEAPREWTCDVPGVGRIRSVTFQDHSGAGLILHLPAIGDRTAAGLGLEPHVQALCDQPDGLILVAGPRSSGKSTLLGAFVDLINQTRNEHVVTLESEIRTVHEKRRSFISQREVLGDGDAFAAAARDALREKPDVLVIADLRSPEAIAVALDAARAGRLVFGAVAALTASAAVERLIEAFAADRRPQIRALIAGALRAVVAQVLLERPGGGLVAAREVLINSPAVGKLIVDGTTSQLPVAIEAGRRLGMRTMVDALGGLVREGIIDAAEACRRAPNRAALVQALQRDGIDVSDLERRA
jgi:twitching motility protein PilT